MNVEKVIEFISQFEGYSGVPYNCPAGHCTIGFGTKLHDGNCTTEDFDKYRGYTLERGKSDLAEDIAKRFKQLQTVVKTCLNENQWTAVLSLAYNIGVGNFKKSTLLKLINEKNFTEAANEFPKWTRSNGRILQGLVKRRAAEKELFLREV